MKKLSITFIILLTGQILFAQNTLPILRSNAYTADIKQDSIFRKGAWGIDPKQKVDYFVTTAKKVTFYSEIDSITFVIDPIIAKYDFLVIVNGIDTARTQIQHPQLRPNMLKAASKYDILDNRIVPNFSYQSSDNEDLRILRNTLKLDSIAGNGSELLKIFNLMHWVHNQIRHDGNSDNPMSKNSLDMIRICKDENRGLNCRMLATVLNETYLAMDIKSRIITCMPKETDFDDCHVINMVFSKQLKKWIWIDPTNNAYIMSENGELLGIEEVRERLINGKPLILNADANWNKQERQTKEGYLDYYMTKNLYRLQCPLVSEYNLETAGMGKEITYIELLPLDGLEQTPQRSEKIGEKTGTKYIYYKTNNPNLFWAKP